MSLKEYLVEIKIIQDTEIDNDLKDEDVIYYLMKDKNLNKGQCEYLFNSYLEWCGL